MEPFNHTWHDPNTYDPKDNLTPKELGEKISKLKPGTVTYVYMTHDAGGTLEPIMQAVGNMSEHVMLVNHNNLVDMALARDKHYLNFDEEI